MKSANEILDSIYKAYGTDSGILLGIRDKQVVKAIIEFTVNRLDPETPSTDEGEQKFWDKIESDFFEIYTEMGLANAASKAKSKIELYKQSGVVHFNLP